MKRTRYGLWKLAAGFGFVTSASYVLFAQEKSKILCDAYDEHSFGPNFIADAVEKALPALVSISARVSGPFGSEGIYQP